MGADAPGHSYDLPTIKAGAEALLRGCPDGLFAAVDVSGLFVPVPPEVPLENQVVLSGQSLLDHVVPEDLVPVVEAWTTAVATGGAMCSVRLRNDPDRRMQVHFGDVRPLWGIFLCLVVPDDSDGSGHDAGPVSTEITRPRAATLHYDSLAHAIWCDDNAPLMLGWARDEIIGNQATSIVHPDDHPRAITAWMEMLASRRPHQFRARRLRGDGTWVWIEFTIQNYLALPDRDYVNIDIVDISDEMAALESLRMHEELLDRIARTIPIGLLQIDHDRGIVYANARLHDILDADADATLDELLVAAHPEDHAAFDKAVDAVLQAEVEPDLEVRFGSADGGERRAAVNLRPLHDADGAVSGALACLWDITDSARLRTELEDRATFDPLTRCHNRASIMAAVERAIDDRRADGVAVIFLDLNRFKPVNDQLGHHAGDALLRLVADRVRGVLRANDIIGRIGGDEFLVLCRDVKGAHDLAGIAQRVAGAANQADVAVGTATIDLSTSIGVARWSPGMDADALVRNADTAMYESKRRGGGAVVFHDGQPTAEPPEPSAAA